jgi:hypothetical protein
MEYAAVKFSHVFISRPLHEAEELAAMLTPLGLEAVVQPAFDFLPLDARVEAPETFAELENKRSGSFRLHQRSLAGDFGR